jgi:hypothetical protein
LTPPIASADIDTINCFAALPWENAKLAADFPRQIRAV